MSEPERKIRGRAARAVYERGCVFVVACSDELVAAAFKRLTGEDCDMSLVDDVVMVPPEEPTP